MARYKYLYRYSLDYGETWVDLTPAVNSAQTEITQNLCTADFKSAKDTASFVLPAAPSQLKETFIQALLGDSEILVEIFTPGPVKVQWGDEDVMWEDLKVLWEGSVRFFTGYVDRNSIDIRSYPLTASINVKVNDVSTLHMDDKVDHHIYLKGKKVSEIVYSLLSFAGYAYTEGGITESEDKVLEAFVVDKDNSKSYREYIDTLLFELGGYVLNFNEDGLAEIVRIAWDDSVGYSVVDNPLNSEGVTTRTSILKEDGVKLTWSTLKWSANADEVVWQDSISRSIADGATVGEDVEEGRYWPDGGEITPSYMEFDASLMDTPYLTRESRKQNEDLSIIAVENVTAEIQATKNRQAFNDWQYPIIQEFADDYGLTSNPMAWPKKAWYLLRNNTNETVNIQHFRLKGKVLYRDRKNTLKTTGSQNPKEYVSEYIYTESHANQFLQFYWHFLQKSRTVVSWKEVNSERTLGDVVRVSHKGSQVSFDAVIAGMTVSYIGKVKVTAFSAVCVDSHSVEYPTVAQSAVSGSAITAVDGEDGKDGKDAAVISIEADRTTRKVDLRSEDSISVAFTLTYQNVSGTKSFELSTDGGVTWFAYPVSSWGESVTVVSVALQDNDDQTYTFRFKVGDESRTLTITNVDMTVYGKYLGLYMSPDDIEEEYLDRDYFVCSETYRDFVIGNAYEYHKADELWFLIEANDAKQANKLLVALNSMVEGGVELPDGANPNSVSWFKMMVVYKAIFDALFARAITLLQGGSIQSEGFKDTDTEHVGFKIDSNGNAVFANARLTGDSFFYGKFKCPTISSLPNTEGGTSVSASIRAFGGVNSASQWNDIYNFFTSNSLAENVTYNCASSAYTSVSYVKRTGEYFYFYNSSMGQVGVIGRDYSSFGSSYFCSGVTAAQTVTVSYGAGDILMLHDVQQGNAGLKSEQIYWQSISGHRVLCIKP